MANQISKTTAATQKFVPIKEVRDNVVVLDDNSLRSVILATSTNFALKSNDEQRGIIMQFQSFLNSLDFSVQFFIQSRKLDIRPYIRLLEEQFKKQTNDLLKIQTIEYIQFITEFTENADIMNKDFFVVVPYTPAMTLGRGGLFGGSKASVDQDSFMSARQQLEQRVGVVESGLARCGIRTKELETEELLEVFHTLFNPGDVQKPLPKILK